MRVTHVCFVGTRTEHYDETVSLFRDILGMPTGFEYPGWSGFKLSTGNRDFVEVLSAADRDERVFPREAGSGPLGWRPTRGVNSSRRRFRQEPMRLL